MLTVDTTFKSETLFILGPKRHLLEKPEEMRERARTEELVLRLSVAHRCVCVRVCVCTRMFECALVGCVCL